MSFISYLQAAKRDCRMFVGLKSMAEKVGDEIDEIQTHVNV